MYKRNLMLLLGALSLPVWAGVPPLGGYYYGDSTAPSGWEWQSPDSLAYNKQQPHAWFFSFGSVDEARKVLPENSSLWRTLDGEWLFHWSKNPEERVKDFYRTDFDASAWDKVTVPMNWNIVGIQKDGTFKYGEPLYSNQRVIFQHKVAEGDWKGGVMRTPPHDWMTYKNRNEVGAYRRTFSVPADWKDKNVYINFDGVDSFFYLYVNGRYVGFSKNSRNLAQFDITPYLNKKGENVVAVEVYRHSDGSFLESQDMFRLPGIFRSVSLTAKPQIQVRDLKAIPDYDASYTDASLCISADVRNLTNKAAKGYTIDYTLYANKLYSDKNTLVPGVSATATVGDLEKEGEQTATVTLKAGDKVKPWSAEAPYRYTLVGELKDKKGRVVETFSTAVGFRKIEIKQTAAKDDEFGLAGRYYYLNGKTISNTADLWDVPNEDAGNWSLLSVKGGTLTIKGAGTLQAKENDCYAVDVQNGGTVVIEDGTYVGNIHAVYVFEGIAEIKGGKYSIQQTYPDAAKAYGFVLNCYDANRENGTAKILVSGGEFVKFNPADCWAEGAGTNFVVAGYKSVASGTDVWKVVKE